MKQHPDRDTAERYAENKWNRLGVTVHVVSERHEAGGLEWFTCSDEEMETTMYGAEIYCSYEF